MTSFPPRDILNIHLQNMATNTPTSITVAHGDGIGPEIQNVGQAILPAAGFQAGSKRVGK
jgi:hypothetical protein